MVRHRALVIFPLLCGFTLVTVVFLLMFDIPSTETHPIFIYARAKKQTERSGNSWSSTLGLPVVQDLLQKIDKFAIAPLRHLLGISDLPPSLNPDIDARGEWQQKQVEKYCRKYGLEGEQYQLPNATELVVRQNLFRHLLFDDTRHLIFCFIPKVGCTNMRRFLFALQGLIPQESIKWSNVSERKYLTPMIKIASFLNTSLTDEQRIHRMMTYYKFIFVRNPLERLLSAFLNKMADPLDFHIKWDTFENHKKDILRNYRPQDLKRWSQCRGNFTLKVTFIEYIRWVIDSDNALLNEHFAPIINDAYPCKIQYHFYGNFKMYSSDMAQIMRKLNVSTEYFWDQSEHKPGHETKDYLQYYYSQLSEELKQRLLEDFHQEFDFYYHLYPEERTSHVELLNVTSLIEQLHI